MSTRMSRHDFLYNLLLDLMQIRKNILDKENREEGAYSLGALTQRIREELSEYDDEDDEDDRCRDL